MEINCSKPSIFYNYEIFTPTIFQTSTVYPFHFFLLSRIKMNHQQFVLCKIHFTPALLNTVRPNTSHQYNYCHPNKTMISFCFTVSFCLLMQKIHLHHYRLHNLNLNHNDNNDNYENQPRSKRNILLCFRSTIQLLLYQPIDELVISESWVCLLGFTPYHKVNRSPVFANVLSVLTVCYMHKSKKQEIEYITQYGQSF